MALDTAAKRYSAVNVGAPWRGPALFPDGAIEVRDRLALGGLYSGILPGGFYQLEPTSGEFVWTGYDADLVKGAPIDAEVANRYSALNPMMPWRGQAAFPDGVASSAKRRARVGLWSANATANEFELVAEHADYNWTGNDATFTLTVNIGTATKRLAAMNIGNPWRGPATFPTGTSSRNKRYTLVGFYSEFTASYNYQIQCSSGSFVWDGEPAFSDFEIDTTVGEYTMTGSDATLTATRVLSATAGSFAWTGNDINLRVLADKTLIPETGSYALTGNSVTFSRPRTLTAESGAFYMTGTAMVTWPGPGSGSRPAGMIRRGKRYQVEIDGEVYDVDSEDEARELIETLAEKAKASAELALSRAVKAQKRPVRKVLSDARKALEVPEVKAPEELKPIVDDLLAKVREVYESTYRSIQLEMELRRQDQDEQDIEDLLTLL